MGHVGLSRATQTVAHRQYTHEIFTEYQSTMISERRTSISSTLTVAPQSRVCTVKIPANRTKTPDTPFFLVFGFNRAKGRLSTQCHWFAVQPAGRDRDTIANYTISVVAMAESCRKRRGRVAAPRLKNERRSLLQWLTMASTASISIVNGSG